MHASFLDLGNFQVPTQDPMCLTTMNTAAGALATQLHAFPELRTLLMRILYQLGALDIPPNLL